MGISLWSAPSLVKASGRPRIPSKSRQQKSYEIRPVTEREFEQWDEFVRQSPQGTLFHSTPWLNASNIPFRLYGCFRGEEWRGGFAAGVTGPRAGGHPLFTPYMGLLLPKSDARYVTTLSTNKGIATEFARFLKTEFDSMEFRLPPEIVDLQPFIWADYRAGIRYTYRLDVSDLKAVLANMDKSRRNAFSSARRDGIAIDDSALFSEVIRISEKILARQGPVTDLCRAAFRYNEALEQIGRCRGFIARRESGEPLAAIWIVWDDRRMYGLVSAYEEHSASNNAVSLAIWRAIEFAALELGLPEFDFAGSMIPGVEQFVRKFGGTLLPTFTLSAHKAPTLPQRVARKVVRIATGTH